jgi:hypothetical protein
MSELAIQVTNTKAFIDADPVTLTFQREEYSDDGAGGKVKSSSPATIVMDNETKICRLIPQGRERTSTSVVTQTTNGQLDRPSYILLGMPELGPLLQRKDFFSWEDDTWEIVSINAGPAYETKVDIKIRKDN